MKKIRTELVLGSWMAAGVLLQGAGIALGQAAGSAIPGASTQGNPGAMASSTPTGQVVTAPIPTPNPNATPEQIGDSLMAHQRYQAAIEQYKKAEKNTSEVWNKMGVAYQLMLNLEDAARCYETAMKLDPKNEIVLNNLGTVYVTQKQFAKSEKMYRKALKINPKSALVHKNLGTALLAEHKYKKGWEEYQSALANDPEIFQHSGTVRVENPASVQERGAMNYYMAKGCVRAGQADRAIEYLRMAINEGFTTPKKIAADQEFLALRGLPAFEQMLAAQSAQ